MNSLIQAYDGPSVPSLVAHLAGTKFVKEADAPRPAYNLAGTLYLSKSGWLLLSVPNPFVRGVFAAMHEPGIELPPSGHANGFEAHITVMSEEELAQVGGPDKITERGKMFTYSLGRLRELEPDGWSDVAKAWVITVHSDDLQALRRSYGLSSLPAEGKHAFHITVAVRRRGVLGRNDTVKEKR